MIYLLCGYSKTGKDTFYEQISSNNVMYEWQIYSAIPKKQLDLENINKYYVRVAFANAVKIEAAQIYHIPYVVTDKDCKQFIHYKSGELVSARDIYIEWAQLRKTNNIYYWANLVVQFILQNYPTSDIIITDWRFVEEIEYIKEYFSQVTTIRLYRASVETNMNNYSEHALDNYVTDFLIIDKQDNFIEVCTKFPQYNNYTLALFRDANDANDDNNYKP